MYFSLTSFYDLWYTCIMEGDMMDLDEKKVELEWYDNPSIVTNLLILVIALIIIFSQSFAVNSNMSAIYILRSIMNHNSTYLLTLVYFCSLKFDIGKKYFDFLNVFLILLYFLIGFASVFTIFQSFSFYTLLSLVLHVIFLIYLIHTFLRGTRLWKEFRLVKSPFNEITNEGYFYSIMVFAVILLSVNLISATSFDGTVLTLFDCIYTILFARYVYLYFSFLDSKKKKSKDNVDLKMDTNRVEDNSLNDIVKVDNKENGGSLDELDFVTKDKEDEISNKKHHRKRKKENKGHDEKGDN